MFSPFYGDVDRLKTAGELRPRYDWITWFDEQILRATDASTDNTE